MWNRLRSGRMGESLCVRRMKQSCFETLWLMRSDETRVNGGWGNGGYIGGHPRLSLRRLLHARPIEDSSLKSSENGV
jgi:hypothetical protein